MFFSVFSITFYTPDIHLTFCRKCDLGLMRLIRFKYKKLHLQTTARMSLPGQVEEARPFDTYRELRPSLTLQVRLYKRIEYQ